MSKDRTTYLFETAASVTKHHLYQKLKAIKNIQGFFFLINSKNSKVQVNIFTF